MDEFDICIAGAGVIGLAICKQLSTHPSFAGRSILLLDQENNFGQHTSSRNSEVIHAGIYYPKGSLKANMCLRGKELLYDYCARRGIGHKRCGKLIVATDKEEIDTLTGVKEAAAENGVITVLANDSNVVLPRLFDVANENGVRITAVDIQEANLESVFLHLTGRALRD